ncbi:hypothetical protein JW859_01310 [bacterium]|nr:hypothetical protein [bacterium]
MTDKLQPALDLLLAELPLPVVAVDGTLTILLATARFWQVQRAQPAPDGTPLLSAVPKLEDTALLAGISRCLCAAGREVIEPTLSNNFLRTTVIGAPWGALVLFEDLAGRLEEEQMRWEIVDGLVHALQTPLTSITGYAETLLRTESIGTATARSFLERIHEQSGHLVKTVTDLLFLSRLEHRDPAQELAPVDIRRAALEAANAVTHAAEKQGLELLLEIDPQPVMVQGDHPMLESAILNLLDNAVKYSHYGGLIRLSCQAQAGRAWITVADDGIGMPADTAGRIFERFYRGRTARTGDYLGAGLGLAIVHEVVRAHRGQVRVDSAPDQGSTFTIELPLANGRPA